MGAAILDKLIEGFTETILYLLYVSSLLATIIIMIVFIFMGYGKKALIKFETIGILIDSGLILLLVYKMPMYFALLEMLLLFLSFFSISKLPFSYWIFAVIFSLLWGFIVGSAAWKMLEMASVSYIGVAVVVVIMVLMHIRYRYLEIEENFPK